MNATRETVEPAMRAAAEAVCGEHMEIVPPDTRNLMGFYVSLRKLLVEVNDATINNEPLLIYKVRHHRLFFQRPSQAHSRSSRQDLFLHHQFRPLQRIADCDDRRTLQ